MTDVSLAHDKPVRDRCFPKPLHFEQAGGYHVQFIAETSATRDDLKELGSAICRFRDWAAQQAGRWVIRIAPRPERKNERLPMLPLALYDLLDGRYPSRPLGVGAKMRHPSPQPVPVPSGAASDVILDAIRESRKPGPPYRRGDVVRALRDFIPGHLVRDILIDGRTWAEVNT